MFAVQGWNVPTNALVPEHARQRQSAAATSQPGSDSKKRKRPVRDVEKSRKIQATELEKLWDQRFGDTSSKHQAGKDIAATAKSQKSQRKDGIHGSKSAENANHVPIGKARLREGGEGSQNWEGQKDSQKKKKKPKHKDIGHDAAEHDDEVDLGPKRQHGFDESPEQAHRTNKKPKPEHSAKTFNSTTTPQPTTSKTAKSAQAIAHSLPGAPPPPPSTTLTPLQAKMRAKLTSARFRHLNETLYTTSSSTALNLFTTSPDLFAEYHAGFSHQVSSSWPRNPVDNFIEAIKIRGPLNNHPTATDKTTTTTTSITPLPRRKTSSCTIADLGCGDAPLARSLIASKHARKLQLTIHSYDLHAPNTHVTVADIANLPLRDGEADIAIFCLSLMGTNWVDFVEEAWRVLRGDGKGEVWVAEVKSRFGRVDGSSSSSNNNSKRIAGEVVGHSVGHRRKPAASTASEKKSKGAKKKKKDANNDDDEDEGDEADLPADLFTSSTTASTTANANANGRIQQQEETTTTPDLRPFISVLTRRGFQLKPNSIDASNKMFVSMTFFKSGIPTVGKYRGMKWTGKMYERVGSGGGGGGGGGGRGGGKRGGGDEDEEGLAEEEGKVLKPCVYKTR